MFPWAVFSSNGIYPWELDNFLLMEFLGVRGNLNFLIADLYIRGTGYYGIIHQIGIVLTSVELEFSYYRFIHQISILLLRLWNWLLRNYPSDRFVLTSVELVISSLYGLPSP